MRKCSECKHILLSGIHTNPSNVPTCGLSHRSLPYDVVKHPSNKSWLIAIPTGVAPEWCLLDEKNWSVG